MKGAVGEVTPAKVLELIITELGLSRDLRQDTPIFSSRLLDSIDIINLLLVLEETFRVRIEPSTVDIDHLDTAIRISETLQKHRAEQA